MTLQAIIDAPKHRDACPPDLDAYTYAAAQTFGVLYSAVTPEQRRLVKLACFGAPPTRPEAARG